MHHLRKTHEKWETYYKTHGGVQNYPDENLVRLLMPIRRGVALDLGCGTGRHLALLKELDFGPIYATDISKEALDTSCEIFPFVHSLDLPAKIWSDSAFEFDLAPSSLQVIVAWGVLHYNPQNTVDAMLREVRRLLIPKQGVFVGTLRAHTDTHLNTKSQLASYQGWKLYDEEECRQLLSQYFADVQLGYMERTPVGNREIRTQRICHWIFRVMV